MPLIKCIKIPEQYIELLSEFLEEKGFDDGDDIRHSMFIQLFPEWFATLTPDEAYEGNIYPI